MSCLPKIRLNCKSGYTLIELSVVMALIGILTGIVVIAINPTKRLAQARDAKRKNDIAAIANALIGYYTLTGVYPRERICDTSRGSDIGGSGDSNCASGLDNPLGGGTEWLITDPEPLTLHKQLVLAQGFLKKLPVDPVNDSTYYYRYEPKDNTTWTCEPGGANDCTYYWVGARLEAPDDASAAGKKVFRCTDYPVIAGCAEVVFADKIFTAGGQSFDNSRPGIGLP